LWFDIAKLGWDSLAEHKSANVFESIQNKMKPITLKSCYVDLYELFSVSSLWTMKGIDA